ncbi:MAG: ABC transporter substrate-binding protein [Pseudomonadota bacterium]
MTLLKRVATTGMAAGLAASLLTGAAADEAPAPADWAAVEAAAKGQTVHWYAWGGESHINDFIAWVGDEVRERYGVTVNHVKLSDTAEAVARVLAETSAGKDKGGAVDLVWINGENFVSMKVNGLLYGGEWAHHLPNRALVDLDRYGAAILTDFGVAVEGMQSPWGRAQLTMLYDAGRLANPPRTLEGLMAFVEANPGRFAYPQPPDFVGTSFLKQLLLMSVPDPAVLRAPAGEDGEEIVKTLLLPVLERLHPHLWRSGRAFPVSVSDLRRLYADGEIDIALTHNPNDGRAGVLAGTLPPGTEVTAFAQGSLGNVHFVAIPHNAAHKAGAMVVANFLLSPEAQSAKADPSVWGDPSVLALGALDRDARALFGAEVDVGAPTLAEPHASWTPLIEAAWSEAFLQ